jgi:hypothetical protein
MDKINHVDRKIYKSHKNEQANQNSEQTQKQK